jgi:phage gpG-like protein
MLNVKMVGFDEIAKRLQASIDAGPRLTKAVQRAGVVVESEAKREVYAGRPDHLIGDSGTLKRSITHQMVGPYAVAVGSNLVYARIHELGGVIKPINGPYLKFQVKNFVPATRTLKNGTSFSYTQRVGAGWVSVKQVTIPKRPYLGPSRDKKMPEITNSFLRAVGEPLL